MQTSILRLWLICYNTRQSLKGEHPLRFINDRCSNLGFGRAIVELWTPPMLDVLHVVSSYVETTRSMICFEFFKSRGKQLLFAFVSIASWSSSNLSILYSFGDANIWRLFDCDILLIPVVWCAGNHLCVIIEGRKQNWFQYNSRKRKPSPCPNCFLYVLSDSI